MNRLCGFDEFFNCLIKIVWSEAPWAKLASTRMESPEVVTSVNLKAASKLRYKIT